MSFVYVFIGGGLGSICRYSIARGMSHYKMDFPLATFIANALSCIVLGYLISLTIKQGMSDPSKLLLMTGFCGGFSTFSTFSAETFQLFQAGNTILGLVYIGVSIAVCLVCIWIGMKL